MALPAASIAALAKLFIADITELLPSSPGSQKAIKMSPRGGLLSGFLDFFAVCISGFCAFLQRLIILLKALRPFCCSVREISIQRLLPFCVFVSFSRIFDRSSGSL